MPSAVRTIPTSSRHLLALTLPMMCSLLLEQMIGLTDVAFLGRVSEVALGASAVAGVFFLIVLMLGFGYAFAAQSIMGRHNGEKNHRAVGTIFIQGVIFLEILALVLIAVSPLLADRLFSFMMSSTEVNEAAQEYLFWRVFGLPFAFACAMFRAFYIATLRPGILTTSSLVMVATNCVLNYFLIFGAGPIPALGITGAAIASTIAEAVCFVFFSLYTLYRINWQTYDLFHWRGLDIALQKQLFKIGRWLMFQEAIAFSAWLLFFIAVENLGERALAISNIVRSICSFVFLFIHAFGSTCGAVAANLIGARRSDEVSALCLRGMILSYICVIPVCLGIAVFSQPVLSIFTNIDTLTVASVPTLYVMLGSFLIAIPSMHYQFVLAGIGMTRESMITSLTASVIYMAYTFIIAHSHVDIAVVWSADYVFYLGTGILAYWFWKHARWREKLAYRAQ